ncbi:MAG: putative transporter [Verrucomicrobiales bacterium]|nr:putative transporter [Verrucomicrobiales bacterium]
MIDLFTSNSVAHAIFVLSLVSALGLALGSFKFRWLSLGIAGVLFSGVLFAHFGVTIDPHIMEFGRELGLILFVYTIGMQVGPGIFSSLRNQGLTLNLFAVAIVTMGALIAVACHYFAGLSPAVVAGLFSGATTNTPSLGASLEALRGVPGISPDMMKLPGQGYAVAYPFGVIGIIIAMGLVKKFCKINIDREQALFIKEQAFDKPKLLKRNIEVTNSNLLSLPINKIPGARQLHVVVSRILRNGEVMTARPDLNLHAGDVLHVVGTESDLNEFEAIVGRQSARDLMTIAGPVMTRRMVITKCSVVGKRVQELNFEERHNVAITRISRAEVEFSSALNPRVQLGDTIIAVGKEADLNQVAGEIGNSAKQLNHPQIIPIFVGIALGIIIGTFPIYFPSLPAPFRLGLAGGPLIIAILLSRLGSFGSLIWHMPLSANFMLREIGIVLFLCCVGLKAGEGFVATIVNGDGLYWMLLAALITIVPLLVVGFVAKCWYRLNYMRVCGLLSGSMTDPPALAFANSFTGSDAPSIAYSTVYPLTMILRIFFGQLLVILLC